MVQVRRERIMKTSLGGKCRNEEQTQVHRWMKSLNCSAP
jgi:hypothetical protein